MDNMYLPPAGPPDFRDTRPIGPAAATGPSGQPQTPPDGRRRRWAAGIAAGTLLLCGAVAAGLALTSGSPAVAGPTGQAAVLNSMLSSASSAAWSYPGSALTAGQPTASLQGTGPQGTGLQGTGPQGRRPAIAARCRHAILRLRAAGRPRAALAVRRICLRLLLPERRLLGGIHGQFTFNTASGPHTLAYQRGVIESASPVAIVVRAIDGTTWTWHLVASTVVRENHQRTAASALSAGERVFAGGPVSGGSYDARLIVIRTAQAGGPGGQGTDPAASS